MNTLREHVALAPLTTIGLGGTARYFASCASIRQLKDVLHYAEAHGLSVHIMGGGSNTLFADAGFDGLVVQVALDGITYDPTGLVTARAGVVWDTLVAECVERDLAGIECLSGIPGLVGATPLQNVGAYGQQVSDVVAQVTALDRKTLKLVSLTGAECEFSYRYSRFKGRDANRFVITDVTYQLRPGGAPRLVYPEIAAAVSASPTLRDVRRAVLSLRQRKSMIVDPRDPHSRSCGSFFMNPVLGSKDLERLRSLYRQQGGESEIPVFPEGTAVKVPAGWLVEQAGFARGTRRGNVGTSPNHALAIVNYGGTTAQVLALAEEVIFVVRKKFGLTLIPEPVVVPAQLP
jgi:UDP-N-acetylmuramate dehydrogenase